MRNISSISNCYGCGICATVCPKNIIVIEFNEEGFYEPQINDIEKCIKCGLCLDVCAYSHKDLSLKSLVKSSYAGWSNEPAVRAKSSSGGVGFEIGRSLINKGYKVCGVRYNTEKERAEHYIANTIEELIYSAGSKYIQSYTLDGFKAINKNEKYLVTGTPCQIDSFRRMIQKYHIEDNFVLMDFYCHGVPSMLLWKKYVKDVEKRIGKITYASWRNKFTGWHDSWAISLDNKELEKTNSYCELIKVRKGCFNSKKSEGDLFYAFFLGNMCLGRACYNKCKYKYDKSSADIRIGDMWGNTYKNNYKGVTAAISFTDKGDEILTNSNCRLIEYPFEIVAEGQMKNNPKLPKIRSIIISQLKSERSIKSIYREYRFRCLPIRIVNRLKKMFK